MRQVISLLLISILIFPVAPVSAQDTTPKPELAERLRNMSKEVAKFRQSRVPEGWTAQYLIQDISEGANVEVRLRNGETVVGQLNDIGENGFTLGEGRYFAFRDIATVQSSQSPRLNKTGKILLAIAAAILAVVAIKKIYESA
jgi:hypothetical protein